MIRIDQPDLIYKTEDAKFNAVVDDIVERYEKGQPVLVGTASVEKSEQLSRLLDKQGIPHEVLNAKHHAREAEIVAQAGRLHAVTVATNMAGRGVDILLGGNPEGLARREAIGQGLDPDDRGGRGRVRRRSLAEVQQPSARPRATRSARSAASTCSAPSGTSPAASTTSCAAAPAARATRARAASTCRSRTSSCGSSRRAP